ncbi:hypothetical protein A2866_03085 [Candidatus Roizmanbacteria bacterium RIFCSPHIGHO2_01_FULL_39_8]|jgi:hypothetical protein|uniref:Uncharacterized protein n=3 Tax=Candidatus Roizmaniibacteriota TaxID=1752723 RepID=A0A1F7GGM4_9BACT|nr:MAG: hypothetical protein A2866_03085 [Candidatus Roizmanbacteria bacterium RIFCSPHIGHO2_01_FULL_39_8]OGK26762.1 MAG: hypothetical protein A3C28_01815 [Candidatus Roizmanbacteria bacterium RIFCSPHIGHO2_02_FULL_39_9]OGK36603.1 MAG: hypothetical protein A3F60_01975 [Candidatus Roizmanbacteria bacterium RIFCSPHIGHO2_12_FULL_39_8]
MDERILQFVYLGFLLPSLFALTLVAEGIYKISRHEEGFFTFALGILFLVGLAIAYLFLFKR